MYLHEDRETFRDLILQVADKNGRTPIVVEKDYYVTLIFSHSHCSAPSWLHYEY